MLIDISIFLFVCPLKLEKLVKFIIFL
jgi:hypothetical protein